MADGDRIIALGDIVDRGPDSPAVLDFFRTHPNASSIMGNHERKHLLSFRGEIQPARSQVLARRQFTETLYPDAVAFMAGLPTFMELPEAILVHGFLEPGICGALGDELGKAPAKKIKEVQSRLWPFAGRNGAGITNPTKNSMRGQ